MRELLQDVARLLSAYREELQQRDGDERPPTQIEKAVIDALSRSKWVKVADGLPVVPDGEQRVAVWVCCSNEVLPEMFWSSDGKWWGFEKYGFTHWQYRQDDTPAPPEAE